ncbi:MAG: hypothetical protein CW346_07210 [Bacillaceae bacterium]|nr:hypothetical protein [Bacillaceae bacterium]MBY6271984.1 hypothetical protein [Bacillaceae bacterium]
MGKMLKAKVKNEKWKLAVPVPYFLLHFSVSCLTSPLVWEKLFDAGARPGLPAVSRKQARKAFKNLIKELKHCKGTVLLEVQAKDGTGVRIKL